MMDGIHSTLKVARDMNFLFVGLFVAMRRYNEKAAVWYLETESLPKTWPCC